MTRPPLTTTAGAADADRDLRGFALTFHTEAGHWDLVGHTPPMVFVRASNKRPIVIHTQATG